MTTKPKATQLDIADNAPEGLDLSPEEQVAARKEGATEAIKENAKVEYNYLTDGKLPGAPPKNEYLGSDDIAQFAGTLDLAPDAFAAAVGDDTTAGIPENKIAGLLKLERAGRNRTTYVQALVARLGVKSVYEVTDAGPGYTNDQSAVTTL